MGDKYFSWEIRVIIETHIGINNLEDMLSKHMSSRHLKREIQIEPMLTERNQYPNLQIII